MKTQLIVKTVVVAMATFGAFAFNGNLKTSTLAYKNDGGCHEITNPCDGVDLFDCKIILNNDEFQIWSDLGCQVKMRHSEKVAN